MANLVTTLANDWQIIDGLSGTATVTYLSRTAENLFAAGVPVKGAEQEDVTKEELLAAGALASEVGTKWNLWVSNLAGIAPKVNDKLTDAAGVVWIVRQVEFPPVYTFYGLVCVKGK